jgi:hypothetical protein
VGMDVPDLSTLASARSGTVVTALRAQRYEIELQPLKIRTSGGATAYLKVEKCHTRFPKKTECISYVCHNHNFHTYDRQMSVIS